MLSIHCSCQLSFSRIERFFFGVFVFFCDAQFIQCLGDIGTRQPAGCRFNGFFIVAHDTLTAALKYLHSMFAEVAVRSGRARTERRQARSIENERDNVRFRRRAFDGKFELVQGR